MLEKVFAPKLCAFQVSSGQEWNSEAGQSQSFMVEKRFHALNGIIGVIVLIVFKRKFQSSNLDYVDEIFGGYSTRLQIRIPELELCS